MSDSSRAVAIAVRSAMWGVAGAFFLLLGLPDYPRGGQEADAEQVGSQPRRAVMVEDLRAGPSEGKRRWAVIVGVNRYLDARIPSLQYCVADARLVCKTLAQRCGYDEDQILLLVDDAVQPDCLPERDSLARQLPRWLEKPATGDIVLVFFSGHAFLDEEGRCYLAPRDSQRLNLKQSGFPVEQLRDMLLQCKASEKLLILDCCHAGGAKTADGGGVSGEEAAAVFAETSGLVTLASCRKAEYSHEWGAKQQGLFTYFLCQGLQGAADFDRNGLVDVDELYRHAYVEVRTAAERELGAKQTPARCYPPDTVGVFTLARVEPALPRPGSVTTRPGSSAQAAQQEPKVQLSDDPYRDVCALCDYARESNKIGDRGMTLVAVVAACDIADAMDSPSLKDQALEAIAKTQIHIDDVPGALASVYAVKDKVRRLELYSDTATTATELGDFEGAFAVAHTARNDQLIANVAVAAAKAGEIDTAKAGLRVIAGGYLKVGSRLYSPTMKLILEEEDRLARTMQGRAHVKPRRSQASQDGSKERRRVPNTQWSEEPLCRVSDLCQRAQELAVGGEHRVAVPVITYAQESAMAIVSEYPRDLGLEAVAQALYDLGDLAGAISAARAMANRQREDLLFVEFVKERLAANDFRGAFTAGKYVSSSFFSTYGQPYVIHEERHDQIMQSIAIRAAQHGELTVAREALRRLADQGMGGRSESPLYRSTKESVDAEEAKARRGGKADADSAMIKPTQDSGPALAVVPFDGQQAMEHQRVCAAHLDAPREITNSIGMRLMLIPAGEFMRGRREDSTDPQYPVRITKPFYFGAYEVTQSEYERVMGSNPSSFAKTESHGSRLAGKSAGRLPVEMVSWEDATEFCRRLSAVAEESTLARTYRLPTEAEWEYACRAGSTSRYCFGDDPVDLEDYCWFNGNSKHGTHVVGEKRPNAWGLYDMHGNVAEWCFDRYDARYYRSAPVDDPRGAVGSMDVRVVRGGSWIDGAIGAAQYLRSDYRNSFTASFRHNELGFRVACSFPVPTDTLDAFQIPQQGTPAAIPPRKQKAD